MIYSGIILRCECMSVYVENEISENGLNCSFLDLEDYLPFSLVQLGWVSVHSDLISCTFHFIFVQMLKGIVHLVHSFVQLLFCTIGSICCTFGLYCTLGSLISTNGGKT